jgi:hypothetical protein
MVSSEFFIGPILPGTLCPWDGLILILSPYIPVEVLRKSVNLVSK